MFRYQYPANRIVRAPGDRKLQEYPPGAPRRNGLPPVTPRAPKNPQCYGGGGIVMNTTADAKTRSSMMPRQRRDSFRPPIHDRRLRQVGVQYNRVGGVSSLRS